MSMSFQALHDGLYNALSKGLGFTPADNLQLIQPAAPLLAGPEADDALWGYFNSIPPLSLNHDYVASGGNQFFSDYRCLFSALQGQASAFKQVLGPEGIRAWKAQIRALPSPIPVRDLPQHFLSFAKTSRFASFPAGVATKLDAMALDPITAAQLALMLYEGDPTADPPIPDRKCDWNLGYVDLLAALQHAPPASFTVSSNTWNTDLARAWTRGNRFGPPSLVRDRRLPDVQSRKFDALFVSKGISLSATFKNVLRFLAVPGPWHHQAAFAIAFHQKGCPPWSPSSAISWMNTFDLESGNMARFARTLVVVNQMHIVVTADAAFGPADQQALRSSAGKGVWPVYASSAAARNDVAFDAGGRLTITITSQPNVPVVLGCTVVPAAQYI